LPTIDHTILLVEDNEDDVFLMERALKSAGILNPVCVVEDGQRAIDYLAGSGDFADRARFPYPVVVFLDLKLPRKSGFDVLGWLRGRSDLPQPLIVVLSSSNSPQDIERVTALGAARYAVKPPTVDLFQQLTESFQIAWASRPEDAT
jgi:CheY-like chemotaxis protein